MMNRREKLRYKLMFEKLRQQSEELVDLSIVDKELYSLGNLVNQRQLKIDKIQTFTYISLSKRLVDHSYFHCCVCNETYAAAQQLLQHRFKSKCWSSQEQLLELKQKLYVCRICDKVFTDYKAIIIHIVTELLTNGFTLPDDNLDLSQCVTLIYIEQLYSSNIHATLGKLKGLIGSNPDDIFDEIDKLEAQIDNEEDSSTLEFTIDENGQVQQKNGFLMSVSLGEFKNQKHSFAVPPKSPPIQDKIQIISIDGNNSPMQVPKVPAQKRKLTPTAASSGSTKIRIVDVGSDHVDVRRVVVNNKQGSADESDLFEGISQYSKSRLKDARGSLTLALVKKATSEEPLEDALVANETIEDGNETLDIKTEGIKTVKKKAKEDKKLLKTTQIKEEPLDDAAIIDEKTAINAVEAVTTIKIEAVESVSTPTKPSKKKGRPNRDEASIKREKALEVKRMKEALKKENEAKTKIVKLPKNLPPPREESKRKRTPKRKFDIEASLNPDEIPSDDESTMYSYNGNDRRGSNDHEPLIQEPIVQIIEGETTHEIDEQINQAEEAELFNQLSSVVEMTTNADDHKLILGNAKQQIDELNDTSAELQRALHMEMAKNVKLKKELDERKKPPIKLKIQHGKSILQTTNEC